MAVVLSDDPGSGGFFKWLVWPKQSHDVTRGSLLPLISLQWVGGSGRLGMGHGCWGWWGSRGGQGWADQALVSFTRHWLQGHRQALQGALEHCTPHQKAVKTMTSPLGTLERCSTKQPSQELPRPGWITHKICAVVFFFFWWKIAKS